MTDSTNMQWRWRGVTVVSDFLSPQGCFPPGHGHGSLLIPQWRMMCLRALRIREADTTCLPNIFGPALVTATQSWPKPGADTRTRTACLCTESMAVALPHRVP